MLAQVDRTLSDLGAGVLEAARHNRPLLRADLLRVHVEDGAFLATLRRRALDGPNYRLTDLYDIESRLEGHLTALHKCGFAAAEMARKRLSEEIGYGGLCCWIPGAAR